MVCAEKKSCVRMATLMVAVLTMSFLALRTNTTSAANTAVSDIYVTVPISCNIITTLDSPHTATINPGQAVENIGTTTFNVFCNDNAGYAIYAIGYSGEEYGNTDMLATVGGVLSPSNDIATGLTTSGTSSWSMKLNAVTGTYAPSIVPGFEAYHVVPDTYTKVAYLTSSTDYNTGSSLQSTYKGYISSNQPSGTYNGKVKYTIVHPNNADTPTLPVACASGKICYNPNVSGTSVPDSMGDQAIANNATSATLWASNFQRSGYGFAGWSDKNDWALNINSISGEGVNENQGYHIYGPNQTITFTAGQYSGTNPGLSLYAVWVKSAGNLQSWTGCSGLSVGQVTALTDTRDNNTYAVAKLADGKCWMIENLRLDYNNTTGDTNKGKSQGYGGVFAGLAEPETANFGSTTTANSLYYSGTQGGTASIDIGTTNDPAYRMPRYRNDNTNSDSSINPNTTVANMTGAGQRIYSYGNYYSWAAAIANTTAITSGNTSATSTSLCPSGWRLSQGGDKTRITSNDDNDFWNLIVDKLNGGTLPANYSSNTYPYYTDIPEGSDVSKLVRNFPNNFIYSGYATGSAVGNRGVTGYYWSSIASNSSSAYRLDFYSGYVYPGTGSGNKYYGGSVRCVAGV